MDPELLAALRAAGYTEAEIAKEARYMEHLAREAAFLRESAEHNFGFYHVGEDA